MAGSSLQKWPQQCSRSSVPLPLIVRSRAPWICFVTASTDRTWWIWHCDFEARSLKAIRCPPLSFSFETLTFGIQPACVGGEALMRRDWGLASGQRQPPEVKNRQAHSAPAEVPAVMELRQSVRAPNSVPHSNASPTEFIIQGGSTPLSSGVTCAATVSGSGHSSTQRRVRKSLQAKLFSRDHLSPQCDLEPKSNF